MCDQCGGWDTIGSSVRVHIIWVFWNNPLQKNSFGRKVAGAIRSLVNARVLHETLPVHVLLYGSKAIMILREKKIYRFITVHMDNLRGLLCIRRMDSVPNARLGNCVEK